MPKISVITPVHPAGVKYLYDCYLSLLAQTEKDWKWIILLNNGAEIFRNDVPEDSRVVSIDDIKFPGNHNIGRLKKQCCDLSNSNYILELDCDDELHPLALEKVIKAFETTGADFVYSDNAQWQSEKRGNEVVKWGGYPFSKDFGWKHYTVKHPNGKLLLAQNSPEVTPQNLRHVYWSPDHLRAWRRDAYDRVIGHDESLEVCDDHDLMIRMYLAGCKFHHINECLYYYRVHSQNTVKLKNEKIQVATWNNYHKYIEQLGFKFARDEDLLCLDLGGSLNCRDGYLPVDKDENAFITCNLDEFIWPIADNSVGVLRASDILEHLSDSVNTMNNAYRILKPGGFMFINVPSSNGIGAFCDPTHKSFWNLESFRYYSNPFFMKYVKQFEGQFQIAMKREYYPSKEHELMKMPYVEAHLIKLGDGYKSMGSIF